MPYPLGHGAMFFSRNAIRSEVYILFVFHCQEYFSSIFSRNSLLRTTRKISESACSDGLQNCIFILLDPRYILLCDKWLTTMRSSPFLFAATPWRSRTTSPLQGNRSRTSKFHTPFAPSIPAWAETKSNMQHRGVCKLRLKFVATQ